MVQQIMDLFYAGKTIPQIAKIINLSVATVRYVVNDQILP
jgi:DNA-binding NarL/FixJ family response regulator